MWAIKQFLLRYYVINLQHTLCEDNTTTNFLTIKIVLSDNGFVVFHEASLNMIYTILSSVEGVEFV